MLRMLSQGKKRVFPPSLDRELTYAAGIFTQRAATCA